MGGNDPEPVPSRLGPSPVAAVRTDPSRPKRSNPPEPSGEIVPDGIEYHTRAIKIFGPLMALVPMTVSGLVSLVILWGSQSTLRGVVGFTLAIVSCPTLPIFGFPVTDGSIRWVAVLASSAAVWIAVGALASRRATSRAVAGWPEWRREWFRLAFGIWIGTLIGFAIAGVFLTVDF